MHGSITTRCRRLALGSAVALALAIAPYRIALHGFAPGIDAAGAHAAKGGNGGGNNGNGNGNGGGNGSNGNGGGGNGGNGNDGSSGNGNGGSDGGNNGGGNSGGGNSGAGGSDDGGTGSGKDKGNSHVNANTGDRVEVDGSKITVQHPDGMTEKIESGRFRMLDALGRTIIDRRATPADIRRLKAL
ncbi:hypothetical protein [Mesorhizobium comanense]|uniref:hypothetical protein n=1 Tax=Mesorhizobium comanense TaxID=2502215 RepID=UPI0010F9148E|nr:hypothetical protein [Mesorhizobium comanense]